MTIDGSEPTLSEVQTELERLVRLRWDAGLTDEEQARYDELVELERQLLTGHKRGG